MKYTRCWAIAGLIAALAAQPGWAESRFEASRVVAFGDVHGAYGALAGLLRQTGIIDASGTWQGGTTHLISLGDLLDRGPEARQVLDLLRRLQGEAAAAGGAVHVVLGNHELMNLTGDFRYASAAQQAAFAEFAPGTADDPLAGVRAAFAPDGPYGAWLLEQPVAVVVNGTAFVHGGLSPALADFDVERLNTMAHARLRELLELRGRLEGDGLLAPGLEVNDAAAVLEAAGADADDAQQALTRRFIELAHDPLFADQGPLWYRGNAQCHPFLESSGMATVLAAWAVSRVVEGHTPTLDRRVHTRLGGRVVLADTGMLESYYHGRASAVLLDGADPAAIAVHYADGGAAPMAPEVDDGRMLFPVDEGLVLAALEGYRPLHDADQWQPLEVAPGQTVSVRFAARNARERKAELAAMRLDRLLGLNLVAPVAAAEAGGEYGVAAALWASFVTEVERAAEHPSEAPAPCPGGSVFDLLYAFDGLIGNQARAPASLVYERNTWALGSIDHAQSFGRGRALPGYLKNTPQRLPGALARRLQALDEATLDGELGDLLSGGQIRAVLARRDALLADWTVED